jgi:hypothetical protein
VGEVDTARVWRLLARGGLVGPQPEATSSEAGRPGSVALAKYNGLADPAGTEQLGRWLAVLWEDPEDIALGHVVARELGVRAVRGYNAEGLVELADPLPRGSRVLVLADAFRDAGLVRAMRAIVEQHGGTVAAIAVLVDTDVLATAGAPATPVVSLVSLPGRAALE